MTFERGHYYFNLIYQVEPLAHKQKIGQTVSVDLGEIHPIVSFDGNQTTETIGAIIAGLSTTETV